MGERVAVVTGGARGIGAAAAVALARSQRDVAVGDIREAEAQDVAAQVEALGRRAVAVALDVTDGASVAAAAREVEARLGAVEVLVNCAGWDEFHPFLETEEQFWRKVIAINLEGALLTTRELLGGMIERGWGRIVNVSSDAARVGSSQEAVYAAAKAGVVAFTKTIAREAATSGVTANAVCPGPTETGLLSEMAAGAPDTERLLASLTRAVPMRRLGRPEDVAAAVAFLAGEDAGYITGQTLSVSGGLTMA
ncbi:MAG TPA: SDR family NAD(P)-dependent oxidoreductase [Solirubrobacteraceae bacterium]|nr:SDR family NAD(P)-dependent oxidoreductase [Solirubrobacteraceae bacterium]